MSAKELILGFNLNNQFISTKEYFFGLIGAFNDLAPFMSLSERKDLCFNKLGLKDNNVAEQPFIQAAVELPYVLTLLDFSRKVLFMKRRLIRRKMWIVRFASVIRNLTLKLSVPTLKRNMPSMMAKVSKLVRMVD